MSILQVASFIAAGAGAVTLFVPKAKQLSLLLIALAFALFGLSAVATRHDVLYGIGWFIPAGAFVARYVVDRVKGAKK